MERVAGVEDDVLFGVERFGKIEPRRQFLLGSWVCPATVRPFFGPLNRKLLDDPGKNRVRAGVAEQDQVRLLDLIVAETTSSTVRARPASTWSNSPLEPRPRPVGPRRLVLRRPRRLRPADAEEPRHEGVVDRSWRSCRFRCSGFVRKPSESS